MKAKFEKYAVRKDGEALYRLHLDGEPIREGLTLEEVVEAINRRDEESLGERHVPGGCIR